MTHMLNCDWVVNPYHPAASDNNIGDDDHPLSTIAEAFQRAQPGDAIYVHHAPVEDNGERTFTVGVGANRDE